MTIKNFRHGRLYIEDGSTPTPLQQIVTFSGASFNFTESRNRNLVRDRGEVVEVTVGDDEPIEWGFTAGYEDRTSLRTVRDGVYPNQGETITGLTGGAANLNVPTTYDYEQGSLAIAAGDAVAPGTKLAIGVAPTVAGEFSEELGTSNVEQVVVVDAADGFNVFMPVADTDLDVVYDGVGRSTLNVSGLAAGACTGSINYFNLRLDIYDPCDPPSVKDLTLGTVVETILIEQAFLVEDGFQENEEADEITVSGQAIASKVQITPVP